MEIEPNQPLAIYNFMHAHRHHSEGKNFVYIAIADKSTCNTYLQKLASYSQLASYTA